MAFDPKAPFLFCSVARCGVNLLTKTFGNAVKLQIPHMRYISQADFDWSLDAKRFSGVMHYSWIPKFEKRLRAYIDSDADLDVLIKETLPNLKVVFMNRRNKVEQAISMAKAASTGIYVIEKESTLNKDEIVLDFSDEEIQRYMQMAAVETTLFEDFFKEHCIKPHRIDYEEINTPEMLTTTIETLSNILGYPIINPIVPAFQKMRSTETQQRYNEFLSQQGDFWQ